jgi:NADPH:quinone reductase-like Zn-dependent oxidoreductase
MICTFSRDQLELNVGEDDLVICLAEVNHKPLLTNLSEEGFACLQCLTKQASKLLWATATRVDDTEYPDYSFVQGFMRSIRAEQPDSRIVTIAIEGEPDMATYAELIESVILAAFDSPSSKEVEYVVRDGLIMTGRAIEDVTGNDVLEPLLSPKLQQKPWADGPALQLSLGTPGALESLRFDRDTVHETTDIGPHDVEIETKAWGLNQWDSQSVLGQLDLQHEARLRSDCGGIVTRLGRDCDPSIQLGDRVCMITQGTLRRYARAHEADVVKILDVSSFETATSIIIPGITAYHALVNVARLREGDKILIHSAASSSGQMGVWIAKLQGARVFATAESLEDRQLLTDMLKIPEDHVFSKATSFVQGVMHATEGHGVDVIFNPVPGEEAMSASSECMAPGGHFVEIGRADTKLNVVMSTEMFARNGTFSRVDWTQLSQKATAKLLKETVKLLGRRKIQPPQPLHIFNAAELQNAFRQLQRSIDSGRVIIIPRPGDLVPVSLLRGEARLR